MKCSGENLILYSMWTISCSIMFSSTFHVMYIAKIWIAFPTVYERKRGAVVHDATYSSKRVLWCMMPLIPEGGVLWCMMPLISVSGVLRCMMPLISVSGVLWCMMPLISVSQIKFQLINFLSFIQINISYSKLSSHLNFMGPWVKTISTVLIATAYMYIKNNIVQKDKKVADK